MMSLYVCAAVTLESVALDTTLAVLSWDLNKLGSLYFQEKP